MNVPQITTQTVHSTATAAALGGTPLGIVSVMLWESYHPAHPLSGIEASAIGSVGAAVFAYLWHVITAVIDRLIH